MSEIAQILSTYLWHDLFSGGFWEHNFTQSGKFYSSVIHVLVVFLQMENTIKQSESERERGLETLRRLHDEYKPLKRDIDKMRGSLGLDKVASLDEESSLAE